jgi:hypothetical protein
MKKTLILLSAFFKWLFSFFKRNKIYEHTIYERPQYITSYDIKYLGKRRYTKAPKINKL